MSHNILAIDPGSSKCGLAVVDNNSEVLFKKISPTPEVEISILNLINTYSIKKIIYGTSTTSTNMREKLDHLIKQNQLNIELIPVDEKNSTLDARALYWQETPRRGLQKLLPTSLLEPPEPIDHYAAVVLAQRYLNNCPSN